MDSIIDRYLSTLTPKQLQAYLIAKDHLKDSFSIEESNGFLIWVKKNQISIDSGSGSGQG